MAKTDNVDRTALKWLIKIPNITPQKGDTVPDDSAYFKCTIAGYPGKVIDLGSNSGGAEENPKQQPFSITWHRDAVAAIVGKAKTGEQDQSIKVKYYVNMGSELFCQAEWELVKAKLSTTGTTSYVSDYTHFCITTHDKGAPDVLDGWDFIQHKEWLG